MIERLKNELVYIEEAIVYMQDSSTSWHPAYTNLCKQRRILKRAIKRLERLVNKK